MTKVGGASWAVEVTYACRCGVHYRAVRWRWLDREAMAEEAKRTRREGPLRGTCPSCGAPASGQTDWLELEPSRQRCVLILASNQRHQIAELMRDHLAAVVERVSVGVSALPVAESWLLRPLWRFEDDSTAAEVRAANNLSVASSRSVSGSVSGASASAEADILSLDGELDDLDPLDPLDQDLDDLDLDHELDDQEDTARRRAPGGRAGGQTAGKMSDSDSGSDGAATGVPKVVGGNPWPAAEAPASPTADTNLAILTMERSAAADDDDEIVTIALELDAAGRSLWGQAALQVRPIHLRSHGYPLIGVRLVASYIGRMALIDGIVDVGSEDAGPLFASLSRRFRVQLVLRGGDGTSVIRREVSARDLERNAALCLESARASLARSEYPREAFVQALEHLRDTSLDERLRGAEQTIVAGAYRHLISPRETWVALEHLEASSDKRNLAQLLEADGLSVDEYESIRRRVLVASVEHGLCAPRRFWRRIIASGLVDNFNDYAVKLARARAVADQDGDDLDTEQRATAWARIAELCDLKQLEYPVELGRKLGLESSDRPAKSGRGRRRPEASGSAGSGRGSGRGSDDPNRSRSAAGEIQSRPTRASGNGNMREQLREPDLRLRVATAALANGGSPESIEAVFDSLEQFDEEELLAIMPSLADLGTQAVPGLHAKLESPRQQVRQASAILLGIARDASSIVPLLRRLAREESRIWLDVARAIGGLGTSSLERLCALARQSGRGERFPIEHRELLARIGRAMAEVVIAEGGADSMAKDAVEALSQSSENDIAYAAGRALATLHDVSVAGAQIRGERSFADMTQLRGFAHRAYEAILVPELDILDEEVEAEII